MKKLFVLILSTFIFFAGASAALAADYTTTCGASSCSPASFSPLFPSSTTWIPGETMTKTVQINNNSGTQIRVRGNETTTSGDLDQVVDFVIRRVSDNTQMWTGSLHSFYSAGEIHLLSSGQSDTFSFTSSMYGTAGNAYQAKNTTFNIEIGFESIITPTPTPCTLAQPNVPGPLTLSQVNSTEVKVAWGTVNDVTGYEISWGTNVNADNKGSRSVGVTSETNIGGLDLNSNRYYFKVRSIKDCAKSDWNGVRSIGTGPDLLAGPTATPIPGGSVLGAFFQTGQVAGAQTNELTPSPSPSPEVSPTSIPEVKGAATTNSCNCIWWQILLGELIVAALYYFLVAKDVKQKRHKIIGLVGVIVTFIVFSILNKCLTFSYIVFANTPSLFCKYFIVFDILIIASIIMFKKYRTEKER